MRPVVCAAFHLHGQDFKRVQCQQAMASFVGWGGDFLLEICLLAWIAGGCQTMPSLVCSFLLLQHIHHLWQATKQRLYACKSVPERSYEKTMFAFISFLLHCSFPLLFQIVIYKNFVPADC